NSQLLWLSGADSLPSSPQLGWKAQPSSRAGGVSQGGSPRKGEAFPHGRRQSRFGMLHFGDFDATLECKRQGALPSPAALVTRPCSTIRSATPRAGAYGRQKSWGIKEGLSTTNLMFSSVGRMASTEARS